MFSWGFSQMEGDNLLGRGGEGVQDSLGGRLPFVGQCLRGNEQNKFRGKQGAKKQMDVNESTHVFCFGVGTLFGLAFRENCRESNRFFKTGSLHVFIFTRPDCCSICFFWGVPILYMSSRPLGVDEAVRRRVAQSESFSEAIPWSTPWWAWTWVLRTRSSPASSSAMRRRRRKTTGGGGTCFFVLFFLPEFRFGL